MNLSFKFSLVCLLMGSCLNAGLENYFKKLSDKGNDHSIRNIDFIYMINLDERPEKFEQCKNELAPFNINPYRFSAVNGWKLSMDAINDLGFICTPESCQKLMGTSYVSDNNEPLHGWIEVPGQTYFCHCMSRGAIGIVLSHLSILQDALDSGYETIWVIEDDIVALKDPRVLSDLIDALDLVTRKDWDILFTDRDTRSNNGEYVPCAASAMKPNFNPAKPNNYALKKQIHPLFRQIGSRYGAYSMIVRRRGMQKIVDFIKAHKIFLPYDMEFYLPQGIKMYTVMDDIVIPLKDAPSDNGGANYRKPG